MPEIKKYLNRDGLEEYNSLLPHSSAEMQTYVNDWLDEHPEATTTVQDGAITEPKLADKSVSLRTLADDTVHMLKGAILTGNLSGNVLSADDAYSAPPVALAIEGKSTQNGTPTPDAPVEIESVDSVELVMGGYNLFDLAKVNGVHTVDGTTVTSGGGSSTVDLYSGINARTNFYYGPVARSKMLYLPAGTYHVNVTQVSGTSVRFAGLWVDPDTGNSAESTAFFTGGAATFTIKSGYLMLYIRYEGTKIKDIQINAGATSLDYYTPFNAAPTTVSIYDGTLRSLPNGTKDTLSLTYLRPSTREGYAWYSRELTTLVGRYEVTAFTNLYNNTAGNQIVEVTIPENERVYLEIYTVAGHALRGMSNRFTAAQSSTNYLEKSNFNYYQPRGWLCFAFELDTFDDLAAANAWLAENPLYVLMQLTTPTTTTIDPIELPILPAPDVTVWSDPSTGLQMEYVRDANTVIQNIEQAIADQ